MKKNAFTLIELLSVIVILAIIALIATPIVLNIINDSKDNSLKRSIDLYINSVKTSVTKESMNSNFPKGEITCTILNEQSQGTEYDKDDLICIEDNDENKSSYVKIDIKGETPINGIIKLNNGKIIEEKTWLEMSNNTFYKYESNTIKKLTEDEINNLTSRLPKEYQEVEYIESVKYQYIKTGIFGNIENTIVKVQVIPSNSNLYQCILGTNYGLQLMYDSDGYYRSANTSRFLKTNDWDTIIVSLDNNKKRTITVNEQNSIGNLASRGAEIYLFGLEHNNTLYMGNGSHQTMATSYIGKMKEVKIIQNDILVRNFVPCYSKTIVIDADGIERPKDTVGMYDLVEGKFYTNQGTGEFIKGPDVN